MISISTRVDKQGFWYFVDRNDESKLIFSYIVIGTGGRQGSGEIEGVCSSWDDWQYVDVGFSVLHVGITDLRLEAHELDQAESPRLSPRAELLSRRKSIRNIAAMLMAGWAMMLFPASRVTSAHTSTRNLKAGNKRLDGRGKAFNPYSSSKFDPYFDPY